MQLVFHFARLKTVKNRGKICKKREDLKRTGEGGSTKEKDSTFVQDTKDHGLMFEKKLLIQRSALYS